MRACSTRARAPDRGRHLDTGAEGGAQPGGKRPTLVITFEPLLIEAAGVEATLLHAGRSSQDMHATVPRGHHARRPAATWRTS
jgi:argininosuccinate lyase